MKKPAKPAKKAVKKPKPKKEAKKVFRMLVYTKNGSMMANKFIGELTQEEAQKHMKIYKNYLTSYVTFTR